MSNLTVENVHLRHNAKLLTNKHFWKLLGMTLTIAGIVFGLIAGGMALLMLNAEAFAGGSSAAIVMIGYFVLILLTVLLGGGLTLGYTSALLKLCRNEDVTVKQVFSRMRDTFKAFGLNLWIGLKVLLWMLPLYGIVGLVGFGIAVAGDPNAAELSNTTAQVMLMILPLVVLIAVCALVIPAVLRYMLSTYVLTDKPETGIRACVNASKAMMKGHKWQAFKLTIPLILTMYAISLGISLASSLLTTFIGSPESIVAIIGVIVPLADIAISLYFSVRIALCQSLFYLKRAEESSTAAEPTDE